jgi:hypothetical protein
VFEHEVDRFVVDAVAVFDAGRPLASMAMIASSTGLAPVPSMSRALIS